MSRNRRLGRYSVARGPQAVFEPGSRGRVLANRLHIRRKREMDRAEHDALLTSQRTYLERIEPTTTFTADLIRQMHRDWLGGIYDWAGEYRTVEVAKGDFRWPPAFRIPENMAWLEAQRLRPLTPCEGGSLKDVCHKIAVVHADLLLIHPFREGNGRLARWLADLMAVQAGLAIPDYAFGERGGRNLRERYLLAVRQGYAGEYQPLARFFEEAVLRSERTG